ncbi:hypothetical protein BOTBODRAFT_51965 [Botryobasidium botryosum FD-172 SS1]|uniref:Uncharacterized protein n=1 Tax=Botryobasidium botryosum (strain FD-172 SS1) TaxID=930990 RepID=A0A067MY46_BOTB1|nr:hypothetical protein BOTBODRAFT_51965 [Botryobasidium botryosum FD-172 SS1]
MNLTVTSTLQHQVQNSSLIALDLVSRLPPASSDELVPMLQDFASRANEVSQSILFLNLLHQRAIETMSITNIMKVRGRTNTISMNMGMVVLRPFGLTQTPWHTRHEIGAAQLFTFAASATEIYIEELIDDIDKTVSLAMQLKSQLGSVCKCLLEKHIQLTRTEAETLLTLSASLPGKNDHADILELAKRMHLDLHTLRPWSLTHLDIAIHRLHQLVNEIKGLKIRVAESVRDMPGCPSAGSLAGVNVEEIRNIIEEFRAKHLL